MHRAPAPRRNKSADKSHDQGAARHRPVKDRRIDRLGGACKKAAGEPAKGSGDDEHDRSEQPHTYAEMNNAQRVVTQIARMESPNGERNTTHIKHAATALIASIEYQ